MRAPAQAYSADVKMYLVVGQQTLEVGQVSVDRCTLREPTDLPPGRAELVLHINGHERRWPVVLEEGHRADCKQARFSR